MTERRPRVSAARQVWQRVFDLVWFNPFTHDRLSGMCDQAGFTPGLMKAILSPTFEPGRPVPMRALAAEWRCDPSYVTSQIRELEQRGLVERRFNPEDHRFKTVVLTDKGERVRAELRDRLLEPPEFFAALSASEQRTLRDLLEKLVAASQSYRPKDRGTEPAGNADSG
jgi:DNA-binding MarR family transcriptional regulator